MLFDFCVRRAATTTALVLLAVSFMSAKAIAAISWDSQVLNADTTPAGAGTQWWYNPANWTGTGPSGTAPFFLPPTNNGTAATDTQINAGTATLPGGEGVVYDPTNDPHFGAIAATPANYPFPPNYNPQKIRELYIGRAGQTGVAVPGPDNLLTIKGDLELDGAMVVGRSSGTDGVATNGRVNQLSGKVFMPLTALDIAGADTGRAGIGNGIYDYRSGILDVGKDGGAGIRLSTGSATTNPVTTQPTGASGTAKFIVHNPASGGYVRTYDFTVAAFSGIADNAVTNRDPDGVTRGVGTVEFHFANGGTRAIQVGRNLSINNGYDASAATPTMGTRSSRLDLVLDSAPSVPGGVPVNLGLFDVDFDQIDLNVGSVSGTGDLDGDMVYNDDRVFSNVAGTIHYREGDTISALFGSTKYNWKISYTGNITWTDADNSVIGSITGVGTGTDVVLMGFSVESVGLPGDFNGDGFVNAADYTKWRDNLGAPDESSLSGNGNGTGGVDAGDYTLWKSQFGMPGSGGGGLAASAVPEPGTVLLTLLSVLGLAGVRRRDAQA